jgi:hypothetical protein
MHPIRWLPWARASRHPSNDGSQDRPDLPPSHADLTAVRGAGRHRDGSHAAETTARDRCRWNVKEILLIRRPSFRIRITDGPRSPRVASRQ